MTDYVTLHHRHNLTGAADPYGIGHDVTLALEVLGNMAYELKVTPIWETVEIMHEVSWIDDRSLTDLGDNRGRVGVRSLHVTVEAEKEDKE